MVLQDFCGQPDLALDDTRVLPRLATTTTEIPAGTWSSAALALAGTALRAPPLRWMSQCVGHVVQSLDVHLFSAESRTPALEWEFTVRRERDATLRSLTDEQ